MPDDKHSVARSSVPFLGEVPKEIEEAGDISKRQINGMPIIKMLLGEHLLDNCVLVKGFPNCEGCPFSHNNPDDKNWGRCDLRYMVLNSPKNNASPAEHQIPKSDHNYGCSLILCECGNDTFRIVDKSDYLPEFEAWEGDGTYKICTKCGKVLECPQTAAEQGHSRNISIESYRALKNPGKCFRDEKK
jgi:hypothetical protein